ncbi:hypothetical protein BDR06DRAFT_969243 [Suillus hirtellus]|nr:hypothetical protein BDR06DRAFT_969243 [Suillus hirtellus]
MTGLFPSSETFSATLEGYSTICPCGRSFAQLHTYENHQRTCKKRKKHLSSALAKAKEVWTARKRPCLEGQQVDVMTGLINFEEATVGGVECNPGSGPGTENENNYYSNCLPTHDPEEVMTLEDLILMHSDQECLDVNILAPVMQNDSLEAPDTFYPYPNKSSFLLGDWFWNGSIQKSQKSFMGLLQIIGDPEFQPEDICATRWNFINHQLGSTVEDAEGRAPFEGAGWKKNPIKIKIPVHNHPYKLLWNGGRSETPICVHGELYTSDAFIQAHHELQDSPPEPGCTLDHVAYFNHLPDSFKDFATKHFSGKGPSADFMAHCHRELYHTQWKILLDSEFIEACKHGIVICCCDGIECRFYPKIFTYSADYPENYYMQFGWVPVPQVPHPKIPCSESGDAAGHETASDSLMHRRSCLANNPIENLLKEHLLVPTSNAFSERLGCIGFNLFATLIVDLLHEFELGVWKALFTHLICILSAAGKNDGLVHELDRRKFASNTSEMKKMAAHDFEDILQCAIPVFDGLLPEPHNTNILALLDEMLNLLDAATVTLGKQLRHFQKFTCSAFKTQELKQESERRQCQQLRSLLHALGDYTTSICNFGTTDSYSTELGELEHRTSKKRYCRTDQKNFVEQITKIEWREAHILSIRDNQLPQGAVIQEEEVATSPEAHFHVGKSQNYPENILLFLRRHVGDPAVKDFLPKLQRFLLAKIKEVLTREGTLHTDGLASATVPGATLVHSDWEGRVFIKADRMYRNNIIRLNYTTYDICRAQDVLAITHIESTSCGHPSRQAPLDHVCFLPTAEPDSFGCCHIIPCFAQGLQHLDGRGISHCAQDKLDWKSYYINRFVDWDAFMWYQWGLGVGHTYAHTTMCQEDDPTAVQFEDFEEGEVLHCDPGCGASNSGSDSESELGFDSD